MSLSHHNWNYEPEPSSPTGNDVPVFGNDRYYGQDRVRDYWAPIDQMSRAISAMTNGSNVKLRGADITQGSSPTLINVPAQSGVVRYQIVAPGSIAVDGFPPSANPTTIFIPVRTTEQLDSSLASATLDGSTTNYVKIAYSETDGPTRNRAKGTGSYVYEKVPSFTLTIDATAPTDFELSVATFTGDGVGALSITQSPRWNVTEAVTFADDVAIGGDATVSGNAAISGTMTVTGQATVATLDRTSQLGPRTYTNGVLSSSPFLIPEGEYYANFQLQSPTASVDTVWFFQIEEESSGIWRNIFSIRPTGITDTAVRIPIWGGIVRSDGTNIRLNRTVGTGTLSYDFVAIS